MKTALILLTTVATTLALKQINGVVRSNNEFGLQLLDQLESKLNSEHKLKNLFISSYSIHAVLTMIMFGSAKQTYQQLYQTLGYAQQRFSNPEILQTYRELNRHLTKSSKNTGNLLNMANSIALQKDTLVLPSFINNLTFYFGSEILNEDFENAPHQATENINQWVLRSTEGKIAKLFDSDLDANTVMVLLNAIYFKGNWQYKFERKYTKKGSFQLGSNHFSSVLMMHTEGYFNYASFDDGKLIELPYCNISLAMYVFVPNHFLKHSLVALLRSQSLESRLDQLHNERVSLEMPKFKISDSHSLVDSLRVLGISDVFSSAADLSNIDGRRVLQVSEFKHKTYIEVNEDGSEAAAVTSGKAILKSMPMVHEMNINRPFIFFIRDLKLQTIIFSGVINKL